LVDRVELAPQGGIRDKRSAGDVVSFRPLPFLRLLLLQKSAVGGVEVFLCVLFGSNPALRQSH
jgi:hypothetical protein